MQLRIGGSYRIPEFKRSIFKVTNIKDDIVVVARKFGKLEIPIELFLKIATEM